MGAHGYNLCEEGHIVSLFDAGNHSTAASSEVFSMRDWEHATLIIQKGAGSACTITLESCDDFVPTTVDNLGFRYYVENTAAGDTLATVATATSAGVALSTNTGTLLVIEVNAEDLTPAYPCLRIKHTAATTSAWCAVAILTGGRYQSASTVTEII
jgi:hypothetical protein